MTYCPKIANFSYPTHLTPFLGVMSPVEFLDEPYVAKTRVIGLSVGDDFVIACFVLTVPVCDRQTNRRTDGQLDDG